MGIMTASSRITLRPVQAPRRVRRAEVGPAPIVKWAGGKTKLLDALLARRPMRFRRYFEPFFGGGALYFRLAPTHAVLSDKNPDLMNMYRCVAWNVEAVIRRLRRHREHHCDEHYYEVRERWNDATQRQSEVERAAAFVYLNKTCFNGLYRVNSRGEFNVPVGRYSAPRMFEPVQLRMVSRTLQRSDLRCGDYAEAVADAQAGDFVYFDPPYDPITETANFTSYTASCFGADDQRELARVARTLAQRGVHVMLSNHDTPFIRELYSEFQLDRVMVARAINSKASGRGAVAELIITNPDD
jgi:DNA adenine methylase